VLLTIEDLVAHFFLILLIFIEFVVVKKCKKYFACYINSLFKTTVEKHNI